MHNNINYSNAQIEIDLNSSTVNNNSIVLLLNNSSVYNSIVRDPLGIGGSSENNEVS